MRIAVSGASGLIGRALTAHLEERGDEVVALRRPLAPEALTGTDALVHLAGAGIAGHRWTAAYKREIRSSRIEPTTLLAKAMGRDGAPRVMISASAIGIYGDRGDDQLTESSPIDQVDTFLAGVARDWERATQPAREAGCRVACIRTGIVLDAHGGALAKMLLPFRLGLGGPIGRGHQWWSWISLTDQVRAIAYLLDNELDGAFNLTAPNPVRNRDFARALGRALHRPARLPLPAFAPSLMLGSELAHELLLTSARVLPRALTAAGFGFEHNELPAALASVLE